VLHLGDVIAQMAPMLRRLLGETIDLRTTAGDKSPVKADPGQIAQVVMNLAVNARDAMKHGGRLSIETTDITLSAADSKGFPSINPGTYVLLKVTDTGHGMDADTVKRIFEPFFTTKGPGQGTGLGLSTVYGIVEQSGGHIAVTSEPGSGTTFNICLPRSAEAPHVAEAEPKRKVPRGTESVLVVEDEQLVREFAARVLSRLGYHVHAVESGAAAIAHATAPEMQVDLILTDVVLPELSGPALVEELERRGIGPRIVDMSGYTDDLRVRDAASRATVCFSPSPSRASPRARHPIRIDGVDAAA
jgi:CheY-like chemotaxis protein